jgi:hypothetical protein
MGKLDHFGARQFHQRRYLNQFSEKRAIEVQQLPQQTFDIRIGVIIAYHTDTHIDIDAKPPPGLTKADSSAHPRHDRGF